MGQDILKKEDLRTKNGRKSSDEEERIWKLGKNKKSLNTLQVLNKVNLCWSWRVWEGKYSDNRKENFKNLVLYTTSGVCLLHSFKATTLSSHWRTQSFIK